MRLDHKRLPRGHRARTCEFGDRHRHSATPADRLRRPADYLDLNWAWLNRRCAQLGTHGCAGLIGPRSRLISLEGLDTALGYVGALGRTA